MYSLIFKVGKALAACRCVVHDNLIRGISIALIWEFGILSKRRIKNVFSNFSFAEFRGTTCPRLCYPASWLRGQDHAT